ncbi:UDP-N-acetylmuramoyl-L-alanine:D-glutamate ligase [Campylobacter blaseri]|uniref:UDP-N-acetylmuramoyl-L-alanine--D-glutamate ligase n=1 Tax=Campylobacter blaseri TaxID=2042961 RepID=A0A2P8R1A5_9BACT|nr:UDP-N-acetylmuramoyl-L-alanine--D-glutamate ligase [Campylobacter blaseri]PSM52272.1 UDP-N-acetylmuramoyl-L-alanine--D-glutamate ligase [Campylobacter blaseri]PSM54038.1 UDP-N-acetylmuramoyl-L-alanine--D-glutamate ligase [Campylobacter blaseri]QKF85479.1 UDP-N-acetylmuramoyl-L-alanine:D-glutamate ligase [Campylobacter blaseri]
MKKSLFGYGKTIKAIAKSGGWDIYDDKFNDISSDEYGNYLLPPSKFNPNESELEITTPGFLPNKNIIKSAKNLISEYDYFKDTKPIKVWISGTNGKTTTTQMIQHLMSKFGSVMGGNVGDPLGNLDKNAKFWVLETSSFTIHYTKFAYPKVYALLPVTPDHLSWHGNFEEYEKIKLKPLLMMDKNCTAIISAKYKNIKTKANVIYYDNEQDLAKFCDVNLEDINFRVPFLLDGLMALSIQKLLINEVDVELLNTFKLDKNRIEEFKDGLNRIWVNDTKATNLDATIQAVRRYKDKKVHLILGGDDKGVCLKPLFESFKNIDLIIYAIGSNTEKIVKLSKEFEIKFYRCEFLKIAVEEISNNLKIGEIALLSPACASLDQFSSYEERGNDFKKYVRNINI